MRCSRLVLVVAVAAALAASGCKKQTGPAFNPEPVQPATAEGGAGAGAGTQAVGAEGFKDNQLDAADAGTGGAQEIAPGDLTPQQVEAALRPVYFLYDSDELSGDALAALTSNAQFLKQHARLKVLIEGHCDERGTVEYNLALGARRARNVKQHLVRLGVDGGQLDTISYGKERPAVEGHDESAWSRNRRAEFRMQTP